MPDDAGFYDPSAIPPSVSITYPAEGDQPPSSFQAYGPYGGFNGGATTTFTCVLTPLPAGKLTPIVGATTGSNGKWTSDFVNVQPGEYRITVTVSVTVNGFTTSNSYSEEPIQVG